MEQLEQLKEILTGEFDNLEQLQIQKAKGNLDFPKAEHRNHVCNKKIKNLPKEFDGYFLIEESYYTVKDSKKAMPHLFLLDQDKNGVRLSSYEIPPEYSKEEFVYEDVKEMDYATLKPSEKFVPIIYHEKNGVFEGKSSSMFSPKVKFTIEQKLSNEKLLVSEIMEIEGRRVFGYDVPIEYKRKNV